MKNEGKRGIHMFYEQLIQEINSAESYLEDAVEEGWTKEAIIFQKRYLAKLCELKEMAKEIYYGD